MLITNLKNEINLRYNIIRYKKLHKLMKYNLFEKNNYNLLYDELESMRYKQKAKYKKPLKN